MRVATLLQAYKLRRRCGICDKLTATRVTYNDMVAQDCPAFWCQACYLMLHYTNDGELLDPAHKVFEYQSG